jgi:hypothetical protein
MPTVARFPKCTGFVRGCFVLRTAGKNHFGFSLDLHSASSLAYAGQAAWQEWSSFGNHLEKCGSPVLSLAINSALTSCKDSKARLSKLRSEFFHCGIFADNFASLSTVQSYLCGD